MRLVDTSAWIEALAGSPAGLKAAAQLPAKADWLVPTIVQFEIAKWAARTADTQRVEELIATTITCVVAPLDTRIAVSASNISLEHKLAMADAIVYATAQEYDADLLTCDAHFETLPGVIYIPKKSR